MAHTERPHSTRIASSVASIVCIILLATLFGTRIHLLASLDNIKGIDLIRVLVLLLTTTAIAFVASAEVLEAGFDLATTDSCRAAIYLCIILYVGSKVLVRLFLIERVHVIKTHMHSRRQDRLWLLSIAVLVVGFGTILIMALISPVANFDRNRQTCSIGVPVTVTLPLIVYDILLNVALTAVFIKLLRPLLAFRERNSVLMDLPLVTADCTKPGLGTYANSSRPVSDDSLPRSAGAELSPVIISTRDNTHAEPLK